MTVNENVEVLLRLIAQQRPAGRIELTREDDEKPVAVWTSCRFQSRTMCVPPFGAPVTRGVLNGCLFEQNNIITYVLARALSSSNAQCIF